MDIAAADGRRVRPVDDFRRTCRGSRVRVGTPPGRVPYVAGRGAPRTGDDVGIAYDALGAPVLTNRAVHISVAHCAGRIAVCASPERCAVDIEPATRDFRRAASRYLTPEEEALSDDPLLPGIVWCAKETLYKYAGRRELDFRRDLHVVRLDLAAGTLAGRIGNGEPVGLSVSLDEGFILVYIL